MSGGAHLLRGPVARALAGGVSTTQVRTRAARRSSGLADAASLAPREGARVRGVGGEPSDAALQLLAPWSELRVEVLRECCDEAIRYHWVPVGLVAAGVEALAELLEAFSVAWRSRAEIERIACTGDVVMVERTVFLDHVLGDRDGFAIPVLGVFELRHGKVVAWRDYYESTHDLSLAPAR